MSKRARNLVFGALGLAVVVVTFAVVLPKIANYGDVWEIVKSLEAKWLLLLAGVVVLNIVTYAPPWMLALPGLPFRQALPFTQASTAFTYIAPGGGLVGMAGSFGLLRAWGFESGEVARAVAITGIWNQLSNLLLPVVAVTLLSIEGGQDALLTTAAVVGAVIFTVVVGALALILWTDGLAHSVGALAERVVNRLLRIVRRGPVAGWPDGLVGFRQDTVGLIRRRWLLLTLAAVAGNLAVFLVLLVSLRAVGVELRRGDVDRGVRRLVARARTAAHPADPRRCRARRARADRPPRRARRLQRRGRRRRARLPRVHDPAHAPARAGDHRRLALAPARSRRGRTRRSDGETSGG